MSIYYIYKYVRNNNIIYIGQTNNLHYRHQQHLHEEPFQDTDQLYYFTCTSGHVTDLYEIALINKYHPPLNKKHNYDDLIIDVQEPSWIKYINDKNYNINQGESHPKALLTNIEVEQIIKLLEKGELTNKEIAKRFNVTQSCINSINACQTWTFLHNYEWNIRNENLLQQNVIPDNHGERNPTAVLTEQLAKKIIIDLSTTNTTIQDLAKKYNINASLIYNINNCVTWTYLHSYKKNIRNEVHNKRTGKLTKEEALSIINSLANTKDTIKSIAEKHQVSRSTVYNINRCQNWTQLHNYKNNIRQEAKLTKQ